MTADRIAPCRRRAGRRTRPHRSTSRCRNSSSAPGTPSAAGWPRLPDDFAGIVVVTSGDVPLLDADTLAELIATHSAEAAAATVLTTTLPDPTGLRPHPAHPGPRGHRHRGGGRRHAGRSRRSRRSTPVSTRSTSRRCARRSSRLRPHNAQQELYLTDVISIIRQDGQIVRAKHVDDSRAGRRDQRPRAAGRAGRRAEPAHRGRPSTRGCDDRRPRHHVDRRRRDHRPRHRHPAPARSCWVPPASAGAARSARTPH